MAKLTSYVHLLDADGNPAVFGPGDDVPGWAAKQITNKSAWDSEPEPEKEPAKAQSQPQVQARTTTNK